MDDLGLKPEWGGAHRFNFQDAPGLELAMLFCLRCGNHPFFFGRSRLLFDLSLLYSIALYLSTLLFDISALFHYKSKSKQYVSIL